MKVYHTAPDVTHHSFSWSVWSLLHCFSLSDGLEKKPVKRAILLYILCHCTVHSYFLMILLNEKKYICFIQTLMMLTNPRKSIHDIKWLLNDLGRERIARFTGFFSRPSDREKQCNKDQTDQLKEWISIPDSGEWYSITTFKIKIKFGIDLLQIGSFLRVLRY
jgi:hypothetical protein